MRVGLAAVLALVALSLGGEAIAQAKQPPYWASIAAGKARMRTGPGRNFPAIWLYVRRHLPVRVIATYPSWRKIEDPDGAVGWMQANLLTDERTAMVVGGIRPLRATPEPDAKIVWRAEPGVVGRLKRCREGWCRFDVDGREGYIEAAHLWGVGADEAVE